MLLIIILVILVALLEYFLREEGSNSSEGGNVPIIGKSLHHIDDDYGNEELEFSQETGVEKKIALEESCIEEQPKVIKIKQSVSVENKTDEFLKKGEGKMTTKRCKTVLARTHAEFLNKTFGTNYKQWMKTTWKYSESVSVWMVRFYGEHSEFRNRFLDGGETIHEEYVGNQPEQFPYGMRVVVSIEERSGYRQYQIKGLFRFFG